MNRYVMRLAAVEHRNRLLTISPARFCTGSGSDDANNAKTNLNNLLKDFIAKSSSQNTKKPNDSHTKLMQFAVRPNRKPRSHQNPLTAEHKVKEVAECYPAAQKPQIEHELLTKLRELKELERRRKENTEPQPAVNLKSLIDGMRVERADETTKPVRRRFGTVRKYDKLPLPDVIGSGEMLGIFPENYASQVANPEQPELSSYWSRLEQHQLELMVSMAPDNYFRQVIEWTETGKLWRFPIDNEQGMADEQNVPFYEHVFLEKHLADWCPAKGPVRHFMELVCNGLSKNPFLTVAEKQEHIFWYRDFFESKKDLLPNYEQ